MAGNRKYGKRSNRGKRGGRKTTNDVFSVGNTTVHPMKVQLHGNYDDSSTALRYEQPKKRISYSDLPVNLTVEQKDLVTSWFTNYGEDEGLLGGDVREKKFLVNVDGYFKENEKAGYGVIIWDSLKMPIVVYSECNKHQISAFYHDLQGVNKGLELAIERKLVRVSMRCKIPEVAEYVRSPCRGGSKVHVCLKCFKKHHYKEGNDKTYLLMLDTAGLLQAFYRQKGRPVFDIEAVGEASNKSAAYIAEHGNGKGKMKQGEIFENKDLLSLLVEEACIQQASSKRDDGEDELHHHGCDNGNNGNHVCHVCRNPKDIRMKETSHPEQDSNDNCVQLQPEQLKKSINLRDDLTAKEKEFVKSWFSDFDGGSMDDAVQAWIKDSVKNEGKVLVHVGGYYFKVNQKSGYGVMIRDSILNRPITAYSQYQDSAAILSKCQDSAFYLEMQGMNKGLELAIELELGYVSMRCTSTEVTRFVRMHWDFANLFCCCNSDSIVVVCLRCLKNRYDNQLGEDDDKTYLLLLDTISVLQAFCWQENYIHISIHAVEADNKSVAYIAEHRNDVGKMKLKEILDDGKLLKLLFKEAVIEWA